MYRFFLKRFLDIAVSSFLIIFLFPLFLLLLIASTISTSEFGLFAQQRIGKNGVSFNLHKFKSMKGLNNQDKGIAALSKSRITNFGKLMRKTHLDELPQFFHVFSGKMSLVGPRPEVKSIVGTFSTQDYESYCCVRPGLISPASIKYIEEETILENEYDPENYYLTTILPDKVKLNREYSNHVSFAKDMQIIFSYLILILRKIL